MDLQRKIGQFALEHNLLSDRERILVAVSGGPDSSALLHLLCELQAEFHLHLEVAHLQHGIRGEEAKEDARFVADLAEKLKLPFHLKEIHLALLKSDAGKGNLEAWARVARYRFFADVVCERKLDKVATAHTLDDQGETVLMWTLRGSGMKGLGGMAPLHRVYPTEGGGPALTVIRPLLEVSKAEVLDYLKTRQFHYRIDPSNRDATLLRNWLRLELLPTLQQRVGENLAVRLSRQAELIRGEDELLDQMARKSLERLLGPSGLDRLEFLREPKALRRRILRLWIESARGHLRGLDFVHVEELLRLIEARTPQGRLSIPGGWELVREYEALKLAKRSKGLKPPCYSYSFKIGTPLNIPEARVAIRSQRITAPIGELPTGLTEAVFDFDLLVEPLTVRNFRAGDRIHPLNMAGHRKLKDLFIDRKVPLSTRATLPILVMGKDVLWIPGYARSEIARVSKKTTSILQIKAVTISA